MSDKTSAVDIDENEQIAQRRAKLQQMRLQGSAYRNDFRRDALAADLHARFDEQTSEQLSEQNTCFNLAGRMMMQRIMGKASFIHIQDMSGQMQIYLRRDELPEGIYQEFKKWDLGDIVGVSGHLFKTKTGELSIHASNIVLLTKALRPLPGKFHGLADQEKRYRQRYLDLIVNQEARKTFSVRTDVVNAMREFLNQQGFMEVETPMMHVIPGGATAKPFVTKHNSLDMELYLRVAPELYLKRLVVGGFEKVYEINRNFRNEGMSTRHNPEFTMLEFYFAYADYQMLMDLTEAMLRQVAQQVLGTTLVHYQGQDYDLAQPFARMTVRDSILHFNPDITGEQIDDFDSACEIAKSLDIAVQASYGLGKVQIEIFEKTVEQRLQQPTFITAYPTEVSPLARCNDNDPFITDRFEFFIAGRELANGFSELNDPEDQAQRFRKQVAEKEAGDEEAMHFDDDYIIALEHGLPPTAGEGIGIDRLVMFLTDSPSIRDVLLFPHMRHKT